ncbi:DUF3068 domain-containing protein [Corynebacterium anserum]|uniref:DUF3068 domain-containing protein n=1 Tax=Corynebacterium anserum TaxID=2684406 RepID=A0A7G7YLP9_9CORY|nr:DUF3068 domain-containing protein [Corynebacterium anserum]MBC2681420.1 DUF3068 domain-containing protein [Corynebacterium anserum]QNH95419.1 DUF3068 domain-containing protein [Corynebacterium anserum]
MKKILSFALIFLGTASLVFAIALPTYVVPKGKVIPLNTVSSSGTVPTPGILLDSSAVAADKPLSKNASKPECKGKNPEVSCFIGKDTPVQSQRFVVVQEPSNKDIVTLEVGNSVIRTDRKEPQNLLSASVERIQLDRKTQLPVEDPVSTVDLQPGEAQSSEGGFKSSNEPFVRPGVQYQFPMGTDKKSYPYFDIQTMTTHDIDFVGEEDLRGLKTYRFEQDVPPVEIYPGIHDMLAADGKIDKADEAALSTLRLTFPAKKWGLKKDDIKPSAIKKKAEGAANSEDKDNPDVEMSRYYTIKRIINVEPKTGMIVMGQEEVWMYYAQDQDEANKLAEPENREREMANPQRTAMYFPGKWSDATAERISAKAKENADRLTTMGTTLPWILGIVGILLAVIGFVLHRRS